MEKNQWNCAISQPKPDPHPPYKFNFYENAQNMMALLMSYNIPL